jgi:CRP/FNR family cyclic AMP-dependent transcriptional regulator
MSLRPIELADLSISAPESVAAKEVVHWALDLDLWKMEDISQFMTAYTATPGQNILIEHHHGTFMAIIITGVVDVFKEDSLGVDKLIASLGPGKILGEMGLIDGEPRSASARARSQTTLLVLTHEQFEHLALSRPRLALEMSIKLAKVSSRRLRRTSGRLIEYLPKAS